MSPLHKMVDRIHNRDDFVRLGQSHSLSLSTLPTADRKLISDDAVLSKLVKDDVIRGSDFGAFYDRLSELDKSENGAKSGATASNTSRAEKMYAFASSATDPSMKNDFATNARPRMGIFGGGGGAKKADPAPTRFEGTTGDLTKVKTDPKASVMVPASGTPVPANAKTLIANGEASLKKAAEFEKKGDHGSAADARRDAAQAFANAGDKKRATDAASDAAASYKRAGMTDQAASMYMSAAALANSSEDFERQGELLVEAGRAFKASGRGADAQAAFFAAGDAFKADAKWHESQNFDAIYGNGAKSKQADPVSAARCYDKAAQAYIEGGAKVEQKSDGHDWIVANEQTALDLTDTADKVGKAGSQGSFSPEARWNTSIARPQGDQADAKYTFYKKTGDKLFASGDYANASKYYGMAKQELERACSFYGKAQTADMEELTVKQASANAAVKADAKGPVEHKDAAVYTSSLKTDTGAKKWDKVEGTLKDLEADLKANPNKYTREEASKLADQLNTTAEAAKKDSKWGVLAIIAAIFACLTIVGIPIVAWLATRDTDATKAARDAERIKNDLNTMKPSDEMGPDANVELREAEKSELKPFEPSKDIVVTPDYALAGPTPAMEAYQHYSRAYRAENLDPALQPMIDRRALSVMKKEMAQVENDPNLTKMQKAAYFQEAANYLPPDEKKSAQQKASLYFAQASSSSTDPKLANETAKRALALSNSAGTSDQLKAELEGVSKNLGALAAKEKNGASKSELLHTQALVTMRQASTTDDAKAKKDLYTKAAKLAEDAVAAAPQGSVERAQALETAASCNTMIGNSTKATSLHNDAATAWQDVATASLANKKLSPAQQNGAASDAYSKAAEEYRKLGKDADAAKMDAKSLEYSNRATQAQLSALAPPAFKGDPTKPVTGEQIAAFEEAKLAAAMPNWKAGGAHTADEYREGAKAFAKMSREAKDPAASDYYAMASRRYSVMAEMAAHMPPGAAALTQPPSAQNLKDYAKQTKDEFVASYKAKNGGKEPTDAMVAQAVGSKLSSAIEKFYVHQGDRGGLIDRPNGKKDVGAGTDGRVMVDCATCTFDLNSAMEGAGFKTKSVGATRSAEFGAGHIMLEVQNKDGKPLGYLNNTTYKPYSPNGDPQAEIKSGFRETIGADPSFDVKYNDPDKDPAKKTGKASN